MLDFHVHIARLPDPEELSRELLEKGYRAQIVACEPWEWEKTERLLPVWKGAALPCFGVHPMIARDFDPQNFETLRGLLLRYPESSVGECGLDRRFPGYEPGGIQERLFRAQARLALSLGRPLMLHVVGDHRRILSALEEEGFSKSGPPPIFHRFTGDGETVSRALKLGAIFSLHSDSFRKSSTRKAVLQIPRKNVRFETDADEAFYPATADALVSRLRETENLLKQLV